MIASSQSGRVAWAFRPQTYRRVWGVFFWFLTLVSLNTINLPDIARAGDLSKTEAATENQVRALIPEIEAYIANGMKGVDVPGVAIGIVANNRLIYAKGFGVRSKSSRLPVDTHTIFQIGSNAKAFLTATEAIMVDRGKLRWDDRVVDLYPEFQLKDPWVTREFRVFDLTAQRSGLPPLVNDMLVMLDFNEAALIRSLRHVEPVSSFRTTFAYTNITHLLASRIVAKAAGSTDWNAVLQKELLDPLGMKDSTYTVEAIEAATNHANGHRWTPEGTIEVPFTPIFPYHMAGAGDINSNIEDMARWVRMQLGNGAFDGRRIVSRENLAYTRTPKVAVNDKTSYALGWYVLQTPNGNILWHDGDALSFSSFVGLVPDKNIGVIILTNETNVGAPIWLGIWVLDRILGNAKRDYVAENLEKPKASFAATAKLFAKPANPRPFPPLAPLAGNFVNPSFGEAVVRLDGDALVMELQATGAKLKLEPLDGDIFIAKLMPTHQFGPIVDLDFKTKGFVQFQIDKEGKLNLLRLSSDDGQAYEFTREGAKSGSAKSGPAPAALKAAVSGDFAGMVDIGGGRKMYLECRGTGSPTVVLVSGKGNRADIWSTPNPEKAGPVVFPEVARFTRVCAYDRPGTTGALASEPSRSDPVPEPVTVADAVVDLHALLTASKERGPFVLVGHSIGGLISRLYASTYPTDVSGLVLVDGLSEDLYNRLTPEQRAVFEKLNDGPEKYDNVHSFEQVRAAASVRAMPVIVLTADRPPITAKDIASGRFPPEVTANFADALWAAQLPAQDSLARLFPNAKHITNTNSHHYIQNEQPQLVIDSIREVVDAVRDPTSWRPSETMTAPSGNNP
jgi:CubicO group peptidase (beta-lactamase class C family)/pimeloyl-ACP methyl ester carboxylesterase